MPNANGTPTDQEERELDAAIIRVFGGICAYCRVNSAAVVHEIIPKSLSPRSWWLGENLMPLCVPCHESAHDGSRALASARLVEARRLALWALYPAAE